MNSKILTALVVILMLSLGCVNSAQETAETQSREQNPLFHTVPEGSACVDARGDCLPGLTCVNAVCQKPDNVQTAGPIGTSSNQERCRQNQFKMAFVLVADNNQQITPERMQRLQAIKDVFPETFSAATFNLASVDTAYPIVTITGDQLDDRAPETIAKKFYESNPDDFDFISIFPAAPEFSNLATSNSQVQSFIQGLGKSLFNRSSQFGSSGKLLSVGYYRDSLSVPTTESSAVQILHEAGHQWCCYVGERFSTDPAVQLGILDDIEIHFYSGLSSPYSCGAIYGPSYWMPNADGTYNQSKECAESRKYHPFTLYLMGLYTRENYDFDKKFQLLNATYNDQAVPFKEISINDIIAVEGERTCVNVVPETSVGPTVSTFIAD